MPIYDYICTSCGHEMEVVHSILAEGPSACPKCGSPMRKAFSPPTVHYKGSGWARKEKSASRPSRVARDVADSGASAGESSGSSGSSGSDPAPLAPAEGSASIAAKAAKDPD
jgi:putative FmdB family regulatory protein